MDTPRHEYDFVANAYAPPQPDATGPLADFRDEAAASSVRLVAESFGRRPEDLGESLCLPVENPADLRGIKWSLLLRLVFGVGGIAVGGILALALQKMPEWKEQFEALILSVAMCFSIGGIGLLLTAATVGRSFSRRRIGDRYDALWALGSAIKPLGVSVEDASTFEKMKLVPEDLAWIGFDRSRRMLLIEGIRYRYLIHSEDVLDIEQVAGATTTGIAISYLIDTTTLKIALQYDSVKHELRRQTIGARVDPLMKPITETLVEQATLV